MTTPIKPHDGHVQRLGIVSLAAARIGWHIGEVETTPWGARLTAQRDNRIIALDLRHRGRSTVERFEREEVTVSIGRRGDKFLARRIEDRFLGRASHAEPREALKWFVEYLVENGNRAALDAETVALLDFAGSVAP